MGINWEFFSVFVVFLFFLLVKSDLNNKILKLGTRIDEMATKKDLEIMQERIENLEKQR